MFPFEWLNNTKLNKQYFAEPNWICPLKCLSKTKFRLEIFQNVRSNVQLSPEKRKRREMKYFSGTPGKQHPPRGLHSIVSSWLAEICSRTAQKPANALNKSTFISLLSECVSISRLHRSEPENTKLIDS